MRRRLGTLGKLTCVILATGFLFPLHAAARLILDFELQGIYEDNVVGILSDQQAVPRLPGPMAATAVGFGNGGQMGQNQPYLGSQTQKNADYALVAYAGLGYAAEFDGGLDLFVLGNIEQVSYSTFSEFDTSIAGISAGIVKAGRVFSARLRAGARKKWFGDPERDSTSYGGSIELKQRIKPAIALKEGYDHERNTADAAFFSYTGNSAWAGAEYRMSDSWLLDAGYTFLVREYEEPAGFKVTAHALSAAVRKELSKHWILTAGYERELSRSNTDSIRSRNNISLLGIRYSY